VRWCLGLQVLKLLRRGGTPQYLIAVRVPTEACYDVAGSLSLRNLELGSRPAVRRRFGSFLLGVTNTALLEGEVLRVT
jgi:hypothetical protein